MKKYRLLLLFSCLLMGTTAFSQTYQVVEKQYSIDDSVVGLIVEGTFKVNYTQGDDQELTIVSLSEDASKISVETIAAGNEGKKYLKLSASHVSKPTALIANIQCRLLEFLEISGTSSFVNEGTMKQEQLSIVSSGTSNVYMKGELGKVSVVASGTSSNFFEGNAGNTSIVSSGASLVDISNLNFTESSITASGISNVLLSREGNSNIVSSGMASVKFPDTKTTYSYSNGGTATVTRVGSNATVTIYNTDTASLADIMDSVWEITETAIDRISGSNRKYVWKWRRNKFDGHWGGIDIGINGYNTKDFKGNLKDEDSYLDLRYPKSVAFYLNLLEFNVPFAKNQKWGMTTGLGFEWHNYRFSHPTWLSNEGVALEGFYVDGVGVKKSKLTTCHLTVPLIFEFQTNNRKRFRDSFHVGMGVVGGVRIGTHSKIKFENKDNTFFLVEPIPGETPIIQEKHYSGKKYKDHDDFFLTPLKLDATVRIGWGRINLFANYSIFEMFREGKGPELYPWTVGITLWGW